MNVIIPNRLIIQLLELIKYTIMLNLQSNNAHGGWVIEREVSLGKHSVEN